MSSKKKSLQKRSIVIDEAQLNVCENNMSMAQLKDPNGVFAKMPKSFLIDGKPVPKSLLRKRDLCRQYLLHGGPVYPKKVREIKGYVRPEKKTISVDQQKLEALKRQRKLDHSEVKTSSIKKAPLKMTSHAAATPSSASTKKVVSMSQAPPRLPKPPSFKKSVSSNDSAKKPPLPAIVPLAKTGGSVKKRPANPEVDQGGVSLKKKSNQNGLLQRLNGMKLETSAAAAATPSMVHFAASDDDDDDLLTSDSEATDESSDF